jgi:pectin methylesterase-like acyl-CoA thioesterase
VHAATRFVGQGQVYTTIQDAVDASVDDDTIVVKSGTYSENVTVNKRLSILSETGYESTSVTSKNGLVVFTINADYVSLKGFAISGSSQAAVYLQKGVDHAVVSSNRIYDSGIGVELNEASHNCPSEPDLV